MGSNNILFFNKNLAFEIISKIIKMMTYVLIDEDLGIFLNDSILFPLWQQPIQHQNGKSVL